MVAGLTTCTTCAFSPPTSPPTSTQMFWPELTGAEPLLDLGLSCLQQHQCRSTWTSCPSCLRRTSPHSLASLLISSEAISATSQQKCSTNLNSSGCPPKLLPGLTGSDGQRNCRRSWRSGR